MGSESSATFKQEVRQEVVRRAGEGNSFFHKHMPGLVAALSPRVRRQVVLDSIKEKMYLVAMNGADGGMGAEREAERWDLQVMLRTWDEEERSGRGALLEKALRYPRETLEVITNLLSVKVSLDPEYWASDKNAAWVLADVLQHMYDEGSPKHRRSVSRTAHYAWTRIEDREIRKLLKEAGVFASIAEFY